MNFARNPYLKFILPVSVTVGIFIFLFHKIDISAVLRSIGEARFTIVFITLIIAISKNILIGPYRWKLILKKLDCSISLKESLFVTMSSDPIVAILPLKTGEFTKVLYLKRFRDISYSTSTFSILCEYLLSILALVISIFVGLIIYFSKTSNFAIPGQISVLSLFLLCSARGSKRLLDIWRALSNKIILPLATHLKEIGKILTDFKITFCTSLYLASELTVVYMLAKSLGLHLPVYYILLYIPLVMLAANIPVTVAGLGLREGLILLFFMKFAPAEKLLSLGILYSLLEHIFPVALGIGWTGIYLNRIAWKRKN